MAADTGYHIAHTSTDNHIVLPQSVGDLSLMDSVTGFIQEAYVNVLPAETKIGERVVWAKFVEYNKDDTGPLLLILAYSTGLQAWSISEKGEAKEVLSWHQGIVKAFQFLPTPTQDSKHNIKDLFLLKRPLIALCDNGGPVPPFHNVTFLSLSTGEQVKHIKFKNEVSEILANKKCIIITFNEKIAIFDAATLEDKFTITTCYPSPGIKSNPVSLGSRWLAYADKRLISLARSYGGYEGEGAQSYTATVLQAAKSLGKGLKDLSGQVANSLSGGLHHSSEISTDALYPGVVTVLDIGGKNSENKKDGSIIAHFVAHTTPIVALCFDPTGLLLITCEKRGHKFNVFKIETNKNGSSYAMIHHLYILHRGDTTARVQDITFSQDSRWVSVSTLRGTTHVFPITLYGGAIGLRTHTTPHVVNRLSRFHKSAGITSVVNKSPSPSSTKNEFNNTSPVVIVPLAQIRRVLPNNSNTNNHRHTLDDSTINVRISACFYNTRITSPHSLRDNQVMPKVSKRNQQSLFVITGYGSLIQYDLEPRPIAGLTKDKICDDTAIELNVEPRCEWNLFYPPTNEKVNRVSANLTSCFLQTKKQLYNDLNEKWLSQVEIITHAGPHRRLWMGPQFSFKTYTPPSSGEFSFDDIIGNDVNSVVTRSTPMNIEKSRSVPVLIETVSTGSNDQSPRFLEEIDTWVHSGESQLCEDLADAMQESFVPSQRKGVSGSRVVWVTEKLNSRQDTIESNNNKEALKEEIEVEADIVKVDKVEEEIKIVEDTFSSDNHTHGNKRKKEKKDKNSKKETVKAKETIKAPEEIVDDEEEDLEVEETFHVSNIDENNFETFASSENDLNEDFANVFIDEDNVDLLHQELDVDDDITADIDEDIIVDVENDILADVENGIKELDDVEPEIEYVKDVEVDNHTDKECSLISDFANVQNFIDIRSEPTPMECIDNVLIDSSLGLKKRKNKKKKR